MKYDLINKNFTNIILYSEPTFVKRFYMQKEKSQTSFPEENKCLTNLTQITVITN